MIALASGIGRQVEANLWLEGRLPESAARSILAMVGACINSSHDLRQAYKRGCAGQVLQGNFIAGIRPTILARAIPIHAFCSRLVASGRFRSVKYAESWLRRQVTLSVPALTSAWSTLPLGGRPTWATFTEPVRDTNPFDLLPRNATWLHDALGLDPRTRGHPLLLFVYCPPTTLELRFPTIADAGWGRLFRPAINDPSCTCGWTAPATDDESVYPLPEVVHEPVLGDMLCQTLNILV